jgi:hypothetical protein
MDIFKVIACVAGITFCVYHLIRVALEYEEERYR